MEGNKPEKKWIKMIYPKDVIKKTWGAYLFRMSVPLCEKLGVPLESSFWFPVKLAREGELDFELKLQDDKYIDTFFMRDFATYSRESEKKIPVLEFAEALRDVISEEEWIKNFRYTNMGKDIADLFYNKGIVHED